MTHQVSDSLAAGGLGDRGGQAGRVLRGLDVVLVLLLAPKTADAERVRLLFAAVGGRNGGQSVEVVFNRL